jgi:hypothetical protein
VREAKWPEQLKALKKTAKNDETLKTIDEIKINLKILMKSQGLEYQTK